MKKLMLALASLGLFALGGCQEQGVGFEDEGAGLGEEGVYDEQETESVFEEEQGPLQDDEGAFQEGDEGVLQDEGIDEDTLRGEQPNELEGEVFEDEGAQENAPGAAE